jgi:hypothetical protein
VEWDIRGRESRQQRDQQREDDCYRQYETAQRSQPVVGDQLLVVQGSFGMKQSALLLTGSYHSPYQSTCCAKDGRRDGYQFGCA